MRKHLLVPAVLTLSLFIFSGCSISFGGNKPPEGPDSGDDYDTTIPGAPDSGDEVEGPDSGDEIDLSNEPKSPDSGDEIDLSTNSDEEDEEEDDDDSDEPKSPDSGDEVDLSYDQNAKSPDSGDEETSASDDLKRKARASCNAISSGSTCVEYIGSMWTTAQAKLNCSTSGAFSTKPCPRPALGGCQIGVGSATDIVTWHYSYGGDPYTEALPYAKKACNALPGSQWVE